MRFGYELGIQLEMKHYVQQHSCRLIDIQSWLLLNVEHSLKGDCLIYSCLARV